MRKRMQKHGKKKIPAVKWKYRVILYICLLLSAALSLLNVKNHVFPVPLGTFFYVTAAFSLSFTCLYLVPDIKRTKSKVQEIAMPVIAVLSLQTAMLFSFGHGEMEDRSAALMNACTGAAVCLMVLIMGIYGIYWTMRRQKEIVDGGMSND